MKGKVIFMFGRKKIIGAGQLVDYFQKLKPQSTPLKVVL